MNHLQSFALCCQFNCVMRTFTTSDFQQMERRYRATFFNSISGFKPVHLVGTADAQGCANLAIFNSVVHLGADPPLLGMVVRPHTVERHTLENILQTGAYTLNHVSEAIFRQAHQTSAKYPREVSEFEACGLTPTYLDFCAAPFVRESPLRIGLALVEKIDIRHNGTHFIIGQITGVTVQEDCIAPDGFVDIARAGSIACSGLDAYYRAQRLARLSYAKPGISPTEIR